MLRAVIERPISVTIATLALVVIGISSLLRLPVSLLPTLERPRLLIVAHDADRSRDELSREVVEPLERRLLSLAGVLDVRSRIDDGSCVLILESEWQTDVDRLRIDTERRLAEVSGLGLDELTVEVEAGDNAPILEIAVLGGRSAHARTLFVDQILAPEVGRLEGAGRLRRVGGAILRPVVRPHAAALAARGLTADDVADRLRDVGSSRPLGRLRDGGKVRPLVSSQPSESLASLASVRVGPGVGTPLDELAEVTFEQVPADGIFRLDGAEGVLLEVHRAPGANAVLLAQRTRQLLRELAPRAEGLEVRIVRDASGEVLEALRQLGLAGLLGLGLGALVLRLMLGSLRPTLALVVVVPASVLTAMSAFYLWDVSLDVVSLAGLALAAGMLVDNSIVVLEAIATARARPEDEDDGAATPDNTARDASVRGAEEMGMALVASFITTAVVFVPLIYLQGLARAFFGVQAFAIVTTLAISLALSLSLTPVLARRMVRRQGLSSSVPKGFSPGLGLYRRTLDAALGHPGLTALLALVVLAAGALVVPLLPRELVPQGTSRILQLDLRLPPGLDRPAVAERLGGVEAVLRRHGGEAAEVMTIHRGEDARWDSDDDGEWSEVEVRFPDTDSLGRALPQLRGMLEHQPGLTGRVRVQRSAVARSVERSAEGLELEVSAGSTRRAVRLSERVAAAIDAADQGPVWVVGHPQGDASQSRPAWVLGWDTPRLAELGGSPEALGDQVRSALGGFFAGRVSIEGVEPDILLEATQPLEPHLLPVRPLTAGSDMTAGSTADTDEMADTARVVPLSAVATLEQRLLPPWDERRGGRPALRLRLDRQTSIAELEATLASLPLEADEKVRFTGATWEMQRSFGQLRLALGLALVLVFLAVAALYESLAMPLVVMTTVPIAAAGAFFGLLAAGQTLNVMSFLGLILLTGIVVNNAIVLIHRGEQRLAAGESAAEAIRAAAVERYRPILMTTLTTLLGMVPLAALGGEGVELRRALAVAVSGGLVTSFLGALMVVPVLYRLWVRRGDGA